MTATKPINVQAVGIYKCLGGLWSIKAADNHAKYKIGATILAGLKGTTRLRPKLLTILDVIYPCPCHSYGEVELICRSKEES